jgi:heme/copper-type cytochrome/quinol oxidase subunit 2
MRSLILSTALTDVFSESTSVYRSVPPWVWIVSGAILVAGVTCEVFLSAIRVRRRRRRQAERENAWRKANRLGMVWWDRDKD